MATNYFVIFEIHLKWRTGFHLQVAFEILKLPVLDQKLCAIEGFQRVYLWNYAGFEPLFEYKNCDKNRQIVRH